MRHHTEALSQNDTNREFFLECEKHWVFWSLILVGGFLGDHFERSKLYDPGFTTEFREAEK